MSRSPPPHSDPWLAMLRCHVTLTSAATWGSLPIARSYRSPSVGSISSTGPSAPARTRSSPRRNSASVWPVCIGKAPVPIVACVAGVIDGDEPTLA